MEAVGLVTQAVSSHKTTAERLLRALRRRDRHPHRKLLEAMLTDVAEGAESPIELMYLRDVEWSHGLPQGRRQKSRLGLRYCSDVGYDAYQLLVELDGRDAHQGTGRFRDMRRDNWAHLAWSGAASSQPSALAGSGSRQTRPRSDPAPDYARLVYLSRAGLLHPLLPLPQHATHRADPGLRPYKVVRNAVSTRHL